MFPVALHLDSLSGIRDVALDGPHVAFVNGDRRIYASDDGGRHWHELP